jgi:hypothetical protein
MSSLTCWLSRNTTPKANNVIPSQWTAIWIGYGEQKMWNKIWSAIQAYMPSVIQFLAIIVLAGALLTALVVTYNKISNFGGGGQTIQPQELSIELPLLAIGGVIVLVLMLTIVAAIFWFLDLTNKNQAMGLPEGSIRAVIALSLIVLFAILSVYLYEGISFGSNPHTLANMSSTELSAFMKDHPTARDFERVISKDSDDPTKVLYNVTYYSSNPTSDDFAKQLLVLLGTLMTAITSFYLGAGTATTAAAQSAAQSATGQVAKPTITGINPTTHSITRDGPTIHLSVMGSNLNIITHVKLVKQGAPTAQLVGTNVTSAPTHIECTIAVSAADAGASWDVEVDDGASQSAKLPGVLRIDQ